MTSKGWTRGPVLGRGSTATVSIASANTTGALFAVKSADLSRSSPLHRELQFLSSLDRNDNVVSCLGHDVSDGLYNLFLEYAPGGSLSHYVAKHGGTLTEPDIRSRTREVLTGLAALHSSNVVHCDVKSQNILIGSAGQAMVADLGCAKSTSDGRIGGTPMFMAPEVARGDRQGTAADIWAVGCVAIEMATGRAPWPEASGDAIAVLHRIAFSDDVPEVPKGMSEEGKDFLGRCLRREAEERWSAEELLRHPFLMNCADSERRWTSPKSILDPSVWESLETDIDTTDTTEEASVDQPQRLTAELVGSVGPDWTWEENWLTVRTDRDDDKEEIVDEESTVMMNNTTAINDDDPSVGEDGFHIASLVTNFRINCDFVVNSEHFISNSNKSLLITVLKTFYWIFDPIPVGTPPLSFSLCCVVWCALWVGSSDPTS